MSIPPNTSVVKIEVKDGFVPQSPKKKSFLTKMFGSISPKKTLQNEGPSQEELAKKYCRYPIDFSLKTANPNFEKLKEIIRKIKDGDIRDNIFGLNVVRDEDGKLQLQIVYESSKHAAKVHENLEYTGCVTELEGCIVHFSPMSVSQLFQTKTRIEESQRLLEDILISDDLTPVDKEKIELVKSVKKKWHENARELQIDENIKLIRDLMKDNNFTPSDLLCFMIEVRITQDGGLLNDTPNLRANLKKYGFTEEMFQQLPLKKPKKRKTPKPKLIEKS